MKTPLRILIAEDDFTSRTILIAVLNKHGHEVVATVNGAEAWQALQQPDAPRLVILDWIMPEMNGVEVCRRVRALETGQQPYIIMLTTKGEKDDISAGLDAGANDYLVKPFDAVGIRARVDVGRRMIEMQSALIEGEKKYRELFESSPVGLYQCTMEGKIISANQACLEIAHCPPSKRDAWFAQDILQSYVHSEDGRRFRELLQRNGSVKGFEADFHRWDGSIGWSINSARIVRDEHGQPVSISGSFEDITERKRVEAERERLAVAIEQLAEVVVITDVRGVIQYVNPAFETVTGYTRMEAVGQNPRILKSGEQEEGFYRGMWETISGGNTWQGRFVNRKKNGSLYTEEATISPVRDAVGGIAYYVAVKRDITEQLGLETQLAQAQKMESIGRLAGGVAHDFNNILQAILGNAQLAAEQTKPADPIRLDLEEIQGASRHAADLTRQLIAFASKEVIAPRTLNLNETVEVMLNLLRRLIGENIELVWTPRANLWPVKMDPSQIDQILTNLCVNARDAIDGIGAVHIAMENVHVDELQAARYEQFLPGDYVLLLVSDTGCGMDKETQSRIFEPFFTTKAAGKGTGLGLATVYGIVRQNRGHIGVYSEPGHGTTFRIHLPRHLGGDAAKLLEGSAKPASKGCETVLLVEDNTTVLNMVERMLRGLGYTVLAAGTPEAALRIAEEHAGEIQLLVTDVIMPGMNGRELAERLKARHPKLKCLFMSGFTADLIARQGTLYKSVLFIQKPFALTVLAAKMREALAEV